MARQEFELAATIQVKRNMLKKHFLSLSGTLVGHQLILMTEGEEFGRLGSRNVRDIRISPNLYHRDGSVS